MCPYVIVGEPSVVKKALYHVTSRLHENPSRAQHLLLSSLSNMNSPDGKYMNAPLMGSYGNYSSRRDDGSAKEFSLRLIIGSLDVASNAFSQVLLRLRANIFEREGAASTFLPALPYFPLSLDMSDGPKFGNKDGQPRNRLYSSYMGGYSPSDLSASDNKGTYVLSKVQHLHVRTIHPVIVEVTSIEIMVVAILFGAVTRLSNVNQVSHRKHGYAEWHLKPCQPSSAKVLLTFLTCCLVYPI
ncbi:RNA-binding KH domain-containing protein, putative isoform 2 [Hibiscus syriacus]|uniref:RNA-binding KH domain-containing protein, putative isoform 2 n=1 Tax=Hibiscus syriacus TaxID=106335 RepID=A0A6A3D0I2_HIBSY|nr:RNA-binding KH domain-containing protein, putative isoform 2 [Hibiscus syriacus]